MKKLSKMVLGVAGFIVFALVLVASVSTADAAPFLTCDAQAGVTEYKITGDAFIGTTITAQADGSMHKDLAGITNGTKSITVSPCNIWGCGTASPFSFTVGIPGASQNIRISGS